MAAALLRLWQHFTRSIHVTLWLAMAYTRCGNISDENEFSCIYLKCNMKAKLTTDCYKKSMCLRMSMLFVDTLKFKTQLLAY